MQALRKFHSIAALCGNGLRPELQALFERLAVDPRSELLARKDGMIQSGPDLISAQAPFRNRRRDPHPKCGQHPASCRKDKSPGLRPRYYRLFTGRQHDLRQDISGCRSA